VNKKKDEIVIEQIWQLCKLLYNRKHFIRKKLQIDFNFLVFCVDSPDAYCHVIDIHSHGA